MRQIKHKWFYGLHFFVAFFLGIGISVGSIYGILLIDEGPFFLKLFPLPFVLVGLFLLYFCVAICINTTTITQNNGQVSIETKPLYWHKPITVAVSEIQGLKVMSSRRQGELTFAYKIEAEMQDGSVKVLVPSSIPIERAKGLKLKEDIEWLLLSA